MRILVVLAVGLAGCGVDETVFVPDYADAWCKLERECSDPATRVFDGTDSLADCLAVEGPRVDNWGEGCRYRAAKAQKCLEEMLMVGCPGGNAPLTSVIPPVCNEIYPDCELPDHELDTAL
ncbi:MAG: hypothetical protein ACI8PZ_005988 [Myxococcota bacterium]